MNYHHNHCFSPETRRKCFLCAQTTAKGLALYIALLGDAAFAHNTFYFFLSSTSFSLFFFSPQHFFCTPLCFSFILTFSIPSVSIPLSLVSFNCTAFFWTMTRAVAYPAGLVWLPPLKLSLSSFDDIRSQSSQFLHSISISGSVLRARPSLASFPLLTTRPRLPVPLNSLFIHSLLSSSSSLVWSTALLHGAASTISSLNALIAKFLFRQKETWILQLQSDLKSCKWCVIVLHSS